MNGGVKIQNFEELRTTQITSVATLPRKITSKHRREKESLPLHRIFTT
jgi:hypothetical protein